MIALAAFAILVLAYRLRRGLATRKEVAVVLIVAANVFLLWAQEVLGPGKPFPEWRYYMQSSILLYGFGIWGLLRLPAVPLGGRRVPVGRVLSAVLVLFAAYDAVMLCKARFPVGRRAAYVAACEWARERIAADWTGPVSDPTNAVSVHEYHTPCRPVVQAHSARLPYLLGGRDTSLADFPEADIPDYWFSDIRRDDPPQTGYGRIGEFRKGKYEFHLYRRLKRPGGGE